MMEAPEVQHAGTALPGLAAVVVLQLVDLHQLGLETKESELWQEQEVSQEKTL